MKGCLIVTAVVLIGAGAGGMPTGHPDTGKTMQTSESQPIYFLEITGSDSEVTFAGECWVRQKDGSEERIPFEGGVPHSRELPGHGLRCDIVQKSAAGSLTVEIYGKNGGNRSRSRTQGAGSRVRMQMR